MCLQSKITHLACKHTDITNITYCEKQLKAIDRHGKMIRMVRRKVFKRDKAITYRAYLHTTYKVKLGLFKLGVARHLPVNYMKIEMKTYYLHHTEGDVTIHRDVNFAALQEQYDVLADEVCPAKINAWTENNLCQACLGVYAAAGIAEKEAIMAVKAWRRATSEKDGKEYVNSIQLSREQAEVKIDKYYDAGYDCLCETGFKGLDKYLAAKSAGKSTKTEIARRKDGTVSPGFAVLRHKFYN